MDWKLTLEYIKVFIWPFVTLTLGFIFRKQITSLSGRVESVETPVGTVTFQNQVEAIASEAAEIEGELAADIAESATINATVEEVKAGKPERSEIFAEIRSFDAEFDKLVALSESDPTMAIMGAWGQLEKHLLEFVPFSFERPRATPGQGLRIIAKRRLIPENLVRLAEDLLILRNRIAHGREPAITKEAATSYIMAAHRVMDVLSLSGTPKARSVKYEKSLHATLLEIGYHVTTPKMDHQYDFHLRDEVSDKVIGVNVKYRASGYFDMQGPPISTRKESNVIPGVLVTNASLSDNVVEFNYALTAEGKQKRSLLAEVVQWRDYRDNDTLVRALMRAAREA